MRQRSSLPRCFRRVNALPDSSIRNLSLEFVIQQLVEIEYALPAQEEDYEKSIAAPAMMLTAPIAGSRIDEHDESTDDADQRCE